MQLLNTQRGVEIWFEDEEEERENLNRKAQSRLELSGGPLSYRYILYKIELHSAQWIHSSLEPDNLDILDERNEALNREQVAESLRWGQTSEHLIDGRAFDGELQLHFYNAHFIYNNKEARRVSQATNQIGSTYFHPNLFSVISVFILAQNNNNKDELEPKQQQQQQQQLNLNGPLDFILNNLNSINDPLKRSIEFSVNRTLIEMLIPNKRHYVTYHGSLNRPPCTENVDWIILNQGLQVERSKLQLLFGNPLFAGGSNENIRPINAINKRLLRTTISLQTKYQQQQQQQQTVSSLDREKNNLNDDDKYNTDCRIEVSESILEPKVTTKTLIVSHAFAQFFWSRFLSSSLIELTWFIFETKA